jgi:molybdate transport system ATP-binding protein
MIEARLQLARQGGFELDVALVLPSRGVSALFGPSGCGKTTVLRALAGLERGATGQVVVDGEVWQDGTRFVPAHERGVGLVFQDAALFPHLTVQGNLDYGHRRIPAGRPRPALDEAIALLGIEPLLARRTEGLSGGERQRVAIARALAMAPRLLLMDEPLASLDARRRAEILPYLERLHEALTLPLVYVTHAVAEVARLADHLVLMEAGRVVASGTAAALMARLEGPLAQGDDAGVVLPCTLAERDERWHLATLRFDGGELVARDPGQPLGHRLRVRVLARDVSLAVVEPQGSSIGNTLPGIVEALVPDSHPAQALALVRVGGAVLMARLTRRSADRLALAPGRSVWVQVKSVALTD